VSTTGGSDLHGRARNALSGSNDSAVLDEALRALLARHRAAEVDLTYAAYEGPISPTSAAAPSSSSPETLRSRVSAAP
jgi:hypothetical protein